MTKNPIISIRNIKKSFGSNHVLKDINLDLYQGESLVIIGGSGTGKSVLIKCIIGLLEPDSGEIFVDGMDILKADPVQRAHLMKRISMLFQGSGLFDSLNVWKNIAFSLLQNSKMDKTTAKALALEKMSAVGLHAAVAELYPAELSGGMKRRVALARAIIEKPEILFFDEPTTGLDPIISSVINDLIITSIKSLGATGLTITHDMHSARQISDRIAMVYDGKIIWQGPTNTIDTSGNEFVDQFINGRPEGPIDVVRS